MDERHLEMETDELFRRIRKKYRFFKRSRAFEKEYLPLLPPCFDKPSAAFSEKERKAYWDWFMENLEGRCEYLRKLIAKDAGIALDSLDYSFESLLPVWKWFLARARILVRRNLPPYEYAARLCPGNGHKGERVSNKFSMHFDVKTEMMIRDIGMYVGAVFTKAYPERIRWECQRMRDVSANLPVLAGFEQRIDHSGAPLKRVYRSSFEPIGMTCVQAARLFHDEAGEHDLYNICTQWTQWISDAEKVERIY